MKQITVTVDPDGNCTIDKTGFKGKSCAAEKAIEEALGQVKSDSKKPEFFVQEVGKAQVGR